MSIAAPLIYAIVGRIMEVNGEISGYLLGSRKPLQNQLYALYQNVWLFFRALTRYFRYNQRSRRFIRWILAYGWREFPPSRGTYRIFISICCLRRERFRRRAR